MNAIFFVLVFPGFIFLAFFGLFAEFVDRKLYARMQDRQGPPWFQPLADFIKLLSKEVIVPNEANARMFKTMPIIALTAVVSSIVYIPLWGKDALYSFSGDLVVVLYFLTIPTLTFFIGGWYSTSLYARIGSVRSLTQMFAYEVPLFMGIFSPALLANSWSLSEITKFYSQYPLYIFFNSLGFIVSLIALLGKLEKAPFDIPEAETEIVAGSFTEYSGRLFGLFRLAIDMEMIVGASLLAAIFLPFGLGMPFIFGFALYVVKILFIVTLLAIARTIFARMRIDQMVNFCWKSLVPLALTQILIILFLKGVILK